MIRKYRNFLSVLLVLCVTISLLAGYSISSSAADEEKNTISLDAVEDFEIKDENATTVYWVSEKNACYSNPEGSGDSISLSSLGNGTYRIDAESFEKAGILSSLCIGAATGTDYVKVYIPDGAGIAEVRNGDAEGSAKGAAEFIIDAEGGTVYESSEHFKRGTSLFRYNISDDVLKEEGVKYNTKFTVQNMHLVLSAGASDDTQKDTVIFDMDKTESFELYNVSVTGCTNMSKSGKVINGPCNITLDNVSFDAATQTCIGFSEINTVKKYVTIKSCDFSSCTGTAIDTPSSASVVVFIKPTDEVKINGRIHTMFILEPQDGHNIVSVTLDGESINVPTSKKTLKGYEGNKKSLFVSFVATYAASVSCDHERYAVGETVTVTAALTPNAADSLASGELKFSYDTDMLTFLSASPNAALLGNDSKATCDENKSVCTASFKTASGKEIAAEKDNPITLATFTFSAKKAGKASFAVTKAVASAKENVSGRVTTVPASATSIDILQSRISTSRFAADYMLLKYISNAKPADGDAYFVGDTVLTYVPAYAEKNDEYVFVALYQEGDVPTSPEAKEKAGTYAVIEPATGNANSDGKTNIADAQAVMYMTRSTFNSKTAGLDWLNSDVNGDGVLDSLDAQAIQYYAHYKKFGQFSE